MVAQQDQGAGVVVALPREEMVAAMEVVVAPA